MLANEVNKISEVMFLSGLHLPINVVLFADLRETNIRNAIKFCYLGTG